MPNDPLKDQVDDQQDEVDDLYDEVCSSNHDNKQQLQRIIFPFHSTITANRLNIQFPLFYLINQYLDHVVNDI